MRVHVLRFYRSIVGDSTIGESIGFRYCVSNKLLYERRFIFLLELS